MSQATSIDHGNESNHPAAVPTTARHRASRLAATVLGAGALLAAASPAGAAIVFQDDFNTGVPVTPNGLNATPTGWSVSDGSVDWINNANSYGDGTNLKCRDTLDASSGCVDLDGSSGTAGIMTRTVSLTGGTQYLLTAYLSGNHRGGSYPLRGPDTVHFGFRDAGGNLIAGAWETANVAAGNTYTLIDVLFTPSTPGTATYQVFFDDQGTDNVGALLDDVTLTAVPLPAAAWLLLSGLVGFVALGRRRQPTPA